MSPSLRALPLLVALCLSAPACSEPTPHRPLPSVNVSPSEERLAAGDSIAFVATVTGTEDTRVTWSIGEAPAGGSVTDAGLYTAPATLGVYHVVATSVANPATYDTATITVTLVPAVQVAVTPHAPSVVAGGTISFSAAVTGSANTGVVWSVVEASCGSITQAGVYTAPGTVGTCHVAATSAADPSRSDTATVTVTAAPVVQVAVTPHAPSVVVGGTVSFSAAVTGSANTGVVWSVVEASCGSITQAGVYTAPGTATTCHVVATSAADSAKSDTATVTVTATPVVQVAVTPRAPSVVAGGTISFSAAVTGSANTGVVWSVVEASCGSITQGGLYTAPGTVGTCHVVATSAADSTKSDTAAVTVTVGSLAGSFAVLAGKAIYFGHQSVGSNLMDGVRALLAVNTGSEPTVVNANTAAQMAAGRWAEHANGANYDPAGKLAAFRATLDSGVGAAVDIAFMKFCWVDFDGSSSWFSSGGTPAGLFAEYQAMVTAVHASYPNLKLVHVTAPLSVDAPNNVRRESYNALVRSTYGGVEPVFDLALLESTDPDGNRVIGTYGPALYRGYTTDAGHLNTNYAQGRDRIAAELVRLLAAP